LMIVLAIVLVVYFLYRLGRLREQERLIYMKKTNDEATYN
jgi:hypothetical protein